MNIPEIILNNAKLSGDSFTNDQLKWRRLKIEELTKKLHIKTQAHDEYKKLYESECEFTRDLADFIKFTVDTLEEDENMQLPNGRKLLKTIQKKLDNQKK